VSQWANPNFREEIWNLVLQIFLCCSDRQLALTVSLGADIDGDPLHDELIRIQHSVKNFENPAPKYFKFSEEIQHGRHAC